MPSFQRLKYPFRRPTHYYTINEPSPTPRQRERQREKERQRARDKIENDLDDGRIGPRSTDSPDDLPVIIDRGPYRGHIYPREQLFFNSIMLASDVEPIYAGPPGGELRQEVHRAPIRRPKTQREWKPSARPVPSEYLTASQNGENLKRWEERNKAAAIEQSQHSRPVPTEYLTATQNAENLRRWEERNGKTPTIRQARIPERRLSPPRGPITPGTRDWDGFMDFPSNNSEYADPSDQVIVDKTSPLGTLPTTETPVALPHPTAVPENTADSVSQADAAPPPASTNSSQVQDQVLASTRLSEFHDRLPPRQASPLRSRVNIRENEEQQQERLLPNGVSPGHYSHPISSHTLYRSPTPNDWPLRGGNEGTRTQLTNGVPLGHYPSSSSSSDNSSYESRHHPPSPPDQIPEHVFALLCSLLTPSELALHYGVVQDSGPPHPPQSSAFVPPSHSASITRIEVRLVQKLHTAVYGLQDRVTGVEEDLIPELSANLEKKHLQVRELDLENLSLHEEIAELKLIVDFSNKVLAGCWEREWEVWRTLFHIQRRRETNCGLLGRIFLRASATNIQDDELLGYCKPEGYVAQPQPPRTAAQDLLKKRELEALLLMAKQNVGILIEDLGEMKGLVEVYQKRDEVEEEETLPVEGSWRDV